jgi:hypothetical protein
MVSYRATFVAYVISSHSEKRRPVMSESEYLPASSDIVEGPYPETGDVPDVYFNGFSVTVGTGDVFVVLKLNNKPVHTLHTSFTVAKTLAQKLGSIVEVLEQRTGRTIMTTDYVAETLGGRPDEDDSE